MNRSSVRSIVVALMLATVTLAGCVTLAVAAGAAAGVVYVQGALVVPVEAAPRAVLQAAEDAVREMGLSVISVHPTDLDGELIARTATDMRVEIVTRSLSREKSELSIRVGVFGDESMSMRIYDQIRARLQPKGSDKPAG